MSTLKEQLLNDTVRPVLVDQCCKLIDEEVSKKRGLKGAAIKAAYKTVKALKRGFVPGVVNALLDEWVEELEPFYASCLAKGADVGFAVYVVEHSEEVSERLLTVTDRRAEKSKHKRAAGLYKRLRGGAKDNVKDALPRLAEVIEGHLS